MNHFTVTLAVGASERERERGKGDSFNNQLYKSNPRIDVWFNNSLQHQGKTSSICVCGQAYV